MAIRIVRADLLLASSHADIVENGCVVVDGDRIAALGPFGDLRPRFSTVPVLDLGSAMILPGFVNAHQHGRGISPLALGYPDDALEPWIVARRRHAPPDVYAITRLAAETMLANGVTATLHANYTYGSNYREELLATAEAYRDAGLRATVCIGFQDRGFLAYEDEPQLVAKLREASLGRFQLPAGPAYAGGIAETIALHEEMRSIFAGEPLLGFAYGPAGPQWVTDESWAALAQSGARHGVGLHFHLLESPAQADFCRRTFGGSTLAHLERLGIFETEVSCAHGVHMSGEDMTIADARSMRIVVNPGSNLRLYNGAPPVAEFHRRGLPVAVGTDNTALSDDEDYLAELRLYAGLARTAGIDGIGPSPRDVLRSASVEGAKAAFLPKGYGQIEQGGLADLIALDCGGFSFGAPMRPSEILGRLLARAKGTEIRLAMTGGLVRYARTEADSARLDHWRAAASSSVARRATLLDKATIEEMQGALRAHLGSRRA